MELNTRKILTCIVLLGLITIVNAQNKYLPGTITFKTGEVQEVLVKFNNWQYSPEKITYKQSENSAIITASLENLNGFNITGKVNYLAADVRIDVSSNIAKQVSNDRAPKWENKRLFLKEIIDSGVKIYSFKNSKYERFFYQKINEDTYEQLIYKPYVSIQTRKSYNRDYRKQLKDNFTCTEQQVDFRELDHTYKSIVGFFIDYNSCLGYEMASVEASKPKATTNFYLKAGIASFGGTFAELPTPGRRTSRLESSYETAAGIVLGLDMELVLPQQGKQWSLLFGAQYEHFRTSGMFDEPIFFTATSDRQAIGSSLNWNIDVSHILFGLGIRRSFILKEDQRLFVNVGINSNFAIRINSVKFLGDADAVTSGTDFARVNLSERNSLYGGFGFISKRLSIETRYGFGREVLSNLPDFKSKYTSLALIFGVRLNK